MTPCLKGVVQHLQDDSLSCTGIIPVDALNLNHPVWRPTCQTEEKHQGLICGTSSVSLLVEKVQQHCQHLLVQLKINMSHASQNKQNLSSLSWLNHPVCIKLTFHPSWVFREALQMEMPLQAVEMKMTLGHCGEKAEGTKHIQVFAHLYRQKYNQSKQDVRLTVCHINRIKNYLFVFSSLFILIFITEKKIWGSEISFCCESHLVNWIQCIQGEINLWQGVNAKFLRDLSWSSSM